MSIRALGVRGVSMTGGGDAPAVELSQWFNFQSYFDSTLLERALVRQAPNEQIASGTFQESQLSGYAVGLHPSSQTPIAIQFKGGQQAGASSVMRLKPGEVVRPFGSPGGVPGRFSGFEWGLPYGWLGGGNALLVALLTPDAKVDWYEKSELVFHRQRMRIYAPGDVPAAANLPYNWPTRFPWPFAVSGANSLPQGGQPILSVKPTRIAMTLRMANLPAAATMRMYFIGTDEWATAANGTVPLTEAVGYDVTWGVWASVASANFATQYETQFLPEEAWRFAANAGSVILVDTTGTLAGQYVDVVRYGEL